MNDPALNKFGELLIKNVRDKTVRDWERIINGEGKGKTAQAVLHQIGSFNTEQREVLLKLVPQIVDTALHHLLFTAEQEQNLKLIMHCGDKDQNLREISDGLAGELYGNQGWIARFGEKNTDNV
jgi:hypothetical protein